MACNLLVYNMEIVMVKKILIIDDEGDFCQLVKLNLEKTGEFEVLISTEGAQGIELAKGKQPDLILCLSAR